MWAMAKLFLDKDKDRMVTISPNSNHKFSFTKNTLDQLTKTIIENQAGVITFRYNVAKAKGPSWTEYFSFIYSYLDDAVSFTPHNIPTECIKFAANLYCDAEFLLNIEMYNCEIQNETP